MYQTAQEWAAALNEDTAAKAAQLGINLHSAACDTMDWSILDGMLLDAQYANTCDAICEGSMTIYEFLSIDGVQKVSWNRKTLNWEGVDLLPYES
jgi:hypothetical protein